MTTTERSRRTRRPKVKLTIGRRVSDDRNYKTDPLLRSRVTEVMLGHDWPVLNRLVYACISCRSVGEAETPEQRDQLVAQFEFTCHQFSTCGPLTTVIFKTEEV